MNHKHENSAEKTETGEYAVYRSRRSDIIAAVICLVLALAVWIGIMNVKDTTYLPLTFSHADSLYTCTLSADSIEVRGRIHSLKSADVVRVRVPSSLEPGTYSLTIEDLEFPDGVVPVGSVELMLTVAVRH